MAKKRVERNRYSRAVRVTLTDQEIHDAGLRMAQKMSEREQVERVLSAIKEEYKGKLSLIDAEMNRNKQLVLDREETREMLVEEIRDFGDMTYTLMVVETGEIVESRKLREDERQMAIDGAGIDE